MIIRIVKMTFKPELVPEFKVLFEERMDRIRNAEGCTHLELLQDENREDCFFTYSHWDRAEDLENYRHSELFKETWALTKQLFSEKAEAWSLKQIQQL